VNRIILTRYKSVRDELESSFIKSHAGECQGRRMVVWEADPVESYSQMEPPALCLL